MGKKFQFSDSDKALVSKAVADLENESSGEVVVYFARQSDEYLASCWKLAGYFGLIFFGIIASLSYQWMLPEDFSIIYLCIYGAGTMLVGFALPYFLKNIRVGLTPDQVVGHRVITKARDIFLDEQIFNTVDRTGVLIYISELERRVQVLGDKGINAKISQEDWNDILNTVVHGIKTKEPAQGIAKAIGKCKGLLLQHGFIVRSDDTNELSDEMRIED